jgi:heme/copper-type cytochrome/quinol oxidase subunit 2
MSLVILEILGLIAALVLVIMLAATVRHRTVYGQEGAGAGSAFAECLWVAVPWLMMAACVLPSVRRIVAGG